MEKADILEMTVSHLRALHRRRSQQQPLQPVSTDDIADRYMAGFRQCAMEVGRYFATAESAACGLGSSASASVIAAPASQNQHLMVGTRLMRHLASLLRHSPVAHLATADRTAPSSSSICSDTDDALGSPQSPSFLHQRNADFLSDEDELHPVDANISTLSFEGLHVAANRDMSKSDDVYGIKNNTVKLEQPTDKAHLMTDRDVPFLERTPVTTPDSRSETEWLAAAGGVVVPLYPSAANRQTPSPYSSSASSFPALLRPPPLTGDNSKPVCFAVREYCDGAANAVPGTRSPKQADEVPIRRQLTSMAAITASEASKWLMPPSSPLAPIGSWASSKSVMFDGEPNIYASDDILRLPTSSAGGIHCGGVWRPW